MSVRVYSIDINGTKTLEIEHDSNVVALNWRESFVSGIPFHGFLEPILNNNWHKIEYNHLTHEWAVDKPEELSEDFIHFCQTGKYPDKVETDIGEYVKPDNQYLYKLKHSLRQELALADCSMLTHDDDGCPSDYLNVHALLELACEIAPGHGYILDAFDEVMDAFERDPQRIIDKLPR